MQNVKFGAYRSRASNPDKCATSWCKLNGDLASLLRMSPVTHCSRQLWPSSLLPCLRISPPTRSGHSASPCHSWSSRSLTSANAGQRRHQMLLNEGRVVALHAEKVCIQSYHELDHLLRKLVCLSHRCGRCHRYKLGRQAQGLAHEALAQEPSAVDRSLKKDVVTSHDPSSLICESGP